MDFHKLIKGRFIFVAFMTLWMFDLSSQNKFGPTTVKRTEKAIYNRAAKLEILPWLFDGNKLKADKLDLLTSDEDWVEKVFKNKIIARDIRNFNIAFTQKIQNIKSVAEMLKIYREMKANPKYNEPFPIMDADLIKKLETESGEWMFMQYKSDDFKSGGLGQYFSNDINSLNWRENTIILNQEEVFSKHPEYKKEYLAYRKTQSEMK